MTTDILPPDNSVMDANRRRSDAMLVAQSVNRDGYIDGRFQPLSGKSFLTRDPFTQEAIGRITAASEADVDRAVSAARRAIDSGPWSDCHPRERANLLFKLSRKIEDHLPELALLEALDAGKRYAGVKSWDIPNAAEVFRYYAGWADKIEGSTIYHSRTLEMYTIRRPVGVVAALIPWNFPFPCASWKLAPALASGCTVIAKSPEQAPLSLQFFASLVDDVGFPPGVVNIIAGGAETGASLVHNSGVDKVTFTGGLENAHKVVAGTPPRIVDFTFELGDKSPFIICDDADLEAASSTALGAAFGVSGQNCCAGSRILVQRSVLEHVRARLIEMTKARILGDQFDATTQQAPQISPDHARGIKEQVDLSLSDGGALLVGGQTQGDHSQFFMPTIIETSPSNRINAVEVFGPVTSLIPFEDDEDAIRIANDSPYGLAASVWSANVSRTQHFMHKLRVGTLWINTFEYFDSMLPWGGLKASGLGKELGRSGIEEFLATTSVVRA